jgi:hypothetical protein
MLKIIWLEDSIPSDSDKVYVITGSTLELPERLIESSDCQKSANIVTSPISIVSLNGFQLDSIKYSSLFKKFDVFMSSVVELAALFETDIGGAGSHFEMS